MITDPIFYLAAVPAVILVGIKLCWDGVAGLFSMGLFAMDRF